MDNNWKPIRPPNTLRKASKFISGVALGEHEETTRVLLSCLNPRIRREPCELTRVCVLAALRGRFANIGAMPRRSVRPLRKDEACESNIASVRERTGRGRRSPHVAAQTSILGRTVVSPGRVARDFRQRPRRQLLVAGSLLSSAPAGRVSRVPRLLREREDSRRQAEEWLARLLREIRDHSEAPTNGL